MPITPWKQTLQLEYKIKVIGVVLVAPKGLLRLFYHLAYRKISATQMLLFNNKNDCVSFSFRLFNAMCMLLVRGWMQNLIQTMEAQLIQMNHENICYRWLSSYQRIMMRQRQAKFPSWSVGETCYRLYLSWLVFSLFHTITMPYRSDVASKFSPWFHATSPTGKRWPCSQKCTSWWEHGGGEIVKLQKPVRNRDGPVACWRMYALAESNHRNKRLNPHFRQLHVKKKNHFSWDKIVITVPKLKILFKDM